MRLLGVRLGAAPPSKDLLVTYRDSEEPVDIVGTCHQSGQIREPMGEIFGAGWASREGRPPLEIPEANRVLRGYDQPDYAPDAADATLPQGAGMPPSLEGHLLEEAMHLDCTGSIARTANTYRSVDED